jgi:hypothetical protein
MVFLDPGHTSLYRRGNHMKEDAQVVCHTSGGHFETCTGLNQHSLVSGRVLGPDGNVLTDLDLPGPTTKRWVIRRKAEIVAAVQGEILSLEEACRRYALTIDEFRAWELSLKRYGFSGLKATRLQFYRGRNARVSSDPVVGPRRARQRATRLSNNPEIERDWLFVGSWAKKLNSGKMVRLCGFHN